jgi:hypothetical protein
MLTVFWDFALAATVMLAWVGVALVLAFIGFFLMDLIGERVYGKSKERGK